MTVRALPTGMAGWSILAVAGSTICVGCVVKYNFRPGGGKVTIRTLSRPVSIRGRMAVLAISIAGVINGHIEPVRNGVAC